MELQQDLSELFKVVHRYPAIDNHAHAFLKVENRDAMPFEGLISEASGPALTEDAIHTLACYKATVQLAKLFGLPAGATWEDVKRARSAADYNMLCRMCMAPTRIQCILIDDGLGVRDMVYDYKWHDRYTASPTKRVVRVEILAEDILRDLINAQLSAGDMRVPLMRETFIASFTAALATSAQDPEVAGFKSVVCYRTGLDVSLTQETSDMDVSLVTLALRYESLKKLRLESKALNDFVVVTTLRIAAQYGKPVQFHTGLGDNDITLVKSSPAVMQPVIKAHPNAKIVLLHSSYPYTQEAGYLTAVYRNVYLDFGEIFPFLSADGQRDVVKQVFELCPTNKIMWSTDGHFWPESYYLGTIQAREAVYNVLEGSLRRGEMSLTQAINIAKGAFFENANRIYNLGLVPQGI
ncbi:hypothetical protein POSPLADRAFT_1071895 [Postia placenta MAD-698-R-SB12]|uniref:Amidohydrolase-related domain-containing protein n=1 Tax=Postia placenta MAD-698-R-SB12 TaxID=670580 RepID=A0A1X6MK58_9APHY|nr:hypothetical protein POSPLADRAFT_1071895 [Postia placenta MAD-698-R-SB12]OSX56698.1 hypothetical protein POSPLADRAFT_1071895 [Postia placenta MAD-698-R-SB12]